MNLLQTETLKNIWKKYSRIEDIPPIEWANIVLEFSKLCQPFFAGYKGNPQAIRTEDFIYSGLEQEEYEFVSLEHFMTYCGHPNYLKHIDFETATLQNGFTKKSLLYRIATLSGTFLTKNVEKIGIDPTGTIVICYADFGEKYSEGRATALSCNVISITIENLSDIFTRFPKCPPELLRNLLSITEQMIKHEEHRKAEETYEATKQKFHQILLPFITLKEESAHA